MHNIYCMSVRLEKGSLSLRTEDITCCVDCKGKFVVLGYLNWQSIKLTSFFALMYHYELNVDCKMQWIWNNTTLSI